MENRGNETSNEGIKLPKNIRQIGEGGGGTRVYLEDYAVTYLHQVKAAVLLGEIRRDGSRTYYFVNGAVEADEAFPEEMWEPVYREAKEAFEGREVIGWFARTIGGTWKITEEMEQVYRIHFAESDPVLVLYDEDEEEEGVFLAENGVMTKQRGYYIYYEKNQLMQDYMIRKNTGKSVEKEAQVSDGAIKSFRKIIEEKTKTAGRKPKEKTAHSRLSYGAAAVIALAVCVIGVSVIQNYDRMKEAGQTAENTDTGNPSIQASADLTAGTKDGTAADLSAMNMPEDLQLAAGTAGAEEQDGEGVQTSGAARNEENVQASGTARNEESVQTGGTARNDAGAQTGGSAQNDSGVSIQVSMGSDGSNGQDGSGETGSGGQNVTAGQNSAVSGTAGNADGSTAGTGSGSGANNNTAGTGSGSGGDNNTAGTGSGSGADNNIAGTGSGSSTGSRGSAGSTDAASGTDSSTASDSADTAGTEPADQALSHSMQAQYVIKEGDTLAGVCEMYYGSLEMIDRICQINDIKNPDQILPGQKILLP